MTYAAGQDILASDFNGFAGVPTGDASPQTNKVGSIYGVGYGDRGYGQTLYTWTAKAAGQDVGSAEWTAMRNALNTCALHQGSSIPTLPPTTVLDPLDTIYAETNPPRPYELPASIATVDTNRLNTNGGLSLTLYPSVYSQTRATTWGAGVGSIQAEFDVDFGSEDQARFFFNSGGVVAIQAIHSVGSPTAKDNWWNAALVGVGAVVFRAHSTSRSGTLGTPNVSLGYYELTTGYQTIFDGNNLATGYYTMNDMLVEARAVSITGLRGAKGSIVRFRVTLTDEALTGDPVSAGTLLQGGFFKADVVLSGIVTPSFSTVTAW